jgi:homoserine acetyltransferase
MLSYRAPVSVDEKFSRGTMDQGTTNQRPTFAVESYLRYQVRGDHKQRRRV